VPQRQLRVALINMPWAMANAPSIQCGLLKSIAMEAGHACDVHYLNMDFAAQIGYRTYRSLAEIGSERLHLLGEWLFSYAAFGEVTTELEYYAQYPELGPMWRELTGRDLDHLTELRREVLPDWLARCVKDTDFQRYDVVGFSSTFLQNTASLALGRMLKEQFPGTSLVYGGANFDGAMGPEYSRHLPWLDYVVSGEADASFPALLDAIAADSGSASAIPGVFRHGHPEDTSCPKPPKLRELSTLPVPDYGDYFERLDRGSPDDIIGDDPIKLPVEFSRGCWWGQKHHCTFCGLTSIGMAYRSKTGEHALRELTTLLDRHPAVHVDAVDNILDMKYLSTFCDELARRHWDLSLFFEVKANLTREQLALFRRAGIYRIQPGIESLSTHLLSLMRKGSTKLVNIRLLKWARYYRISVLWNMLMGFPGETEADYQEQVDLIPMLVHLQPPASSGGRIWLERFSPYFTDRSFPISNIEPLGSYRHIYPSELNHSEIAYFFDYEADQVAGPEAHRALSDALTEWRELWDRRQPYLIYQRRPGKLTIIDHRTDRAYRAVLNGWEADAYEYCGDAPHNAARLHEELMKLDHDVSPTGVAAFLARCCRARVMVEDGGKFLSLALPENPGW
jgi:ribosomal peptide maturation radical SAM protein 1